MHKWLKIEIQISNQHNLGMYRAFPILFDVLEIEWKPNHSVYVEETTLTEMNFEISPPAKYAWQLYSALMFADVHREVADAYIQLGSYYANLLMK